MQDMGLNIEVCCLLDIEKVWTEFGVNLKWVSFFHVDLIWNDPCAGCMQIVLVVL